MASTRITRVFYHATAQANVAAILSKGLLITERGKNPFGLDTGVDYDAIYKDETDVVKKPACIHLTSSKKKVNGYKKMIEQSFPSQTAVILEIKLSLEKAHNLIPDPEEEDDNCFYSIKDISPKHISVYERKTKLVVYKTPSASSASFTSTVAAVNKTLGLTATLSELKLPELPSLPSLPSLVIGSAEPTSTVGNTTVPELKLPELASLPDLSSLPDESSSLLSPR